MEWNMIQNFAKAKDEEVDDDSVLHPAEAWISSL